ncbi:hypothetical protein HUO13_36185 [Saccharopolyspora erythraea]|uniref:hypothetical protein n=1 Tax=Saccharopolyspora erythraea TaxID=1836 RepID=UPI001BAB2A8D|nr:hypothetical protein [Saccharopolyspora erythraea]QUH05499.1 hypothetical protein HUO13_36185 [Saccharopolyspora erythraea]
MGAVVLIALVLIVLILAGGVGAGLLLRKRQFGKYRELVGQGAGWRQVPANPQLWQRVAALRWFAGRRGLQDFFHMAGEHRGVPFEVVQYRRPPGVGERVYTAAAVVYVPRPVPGPGLHLAHRDSWTPLGQDVEVPTGHPDFDRSFLVTSQNPDFARAVMQPGLVEGLLRDGRMRSRVVEFAPEHLVVFATVVATKDAVLPMLDMLVDIRENVPWQTLAR